MTQPPPWGNPPAQPPGGRPAQHQPGRAAAQGQWGQQHLWPTPVPPNNGGAGKWVIAAVALVAAIGVTVVISVKLTKSSDSPAGGAGATTSAAPSDVASANDTGPVGIITEDPTCAPWGPINNTLSNVSSHGWSARDPSVPISSWTPESRAQYEAVGNAMRQAADQTVPLSKKTPHRVMRELYGQFITYSRAYADSLASYIPIDDSLARASSTAGNAITDICAAISQGSAAARAGSVPAPAAPSSTGPVGDLAKPQRMFDTPDGVCTELSAIVEQQSTNPAYRNWLATDPNIAAGNWSPEQQTLTTAVIPVLNSTATALDRLAESTSNPVVRDFIQLGTQYQRTYTQALPTYQLNDQYIYNAGQRLPVVVRMACKYAAG